jgi:hypothetical protein
LPRYTVEELLAFTALSGGDVSEAALILDIDEDYLQTAIEGRKLPRPVEKALERNLEDWSDENPEQAARVESVGALLNTYPELIEILDNDGVSEALINNPEFVDIFYKDPTKYYDERAGKWYSGGGLYPGAIDVIIEWATMRVDRKGKLKRQRDLSPMVNALEADNYDIGDVDESAFWEWFRSIYPG